MLIATKYQAVRILGTGTFGQAWLAVNHETGKNVVIKRINVFKVPQREVDQALMEVAILGKLRHINVIKYKDSFVSEHQLNIVMEYADSGDLHEKISNQNGAYLKENDILDWFVQTMFALRYIHSRHILHRDLKTQNIFLTSRNIIKLGDFGIAKVLQDTADMAITTIGTPYYMSPEICRQQAYNYKSDIWAAGCVLYELCHLQVPFHATNLSQLVMKILSGNYSPLPDMYGPILNDLIRVLLSTEADDRPSVDQVICIPSLQAYVDRYILQCRLIIRGLEPDVRGSRNLESKEGRVGEKRHLVKESDVKDAGSYVTPKADVPVPGDAAETACRAPKSHRLTHHRSHSTANSNSTSPPTFSIYKDVLKKRAVSVNSARRRPSRPKPVAKAITTCQESINHENQPSGNGSTEGDINDEVFAPKEHVSPITKKPKLALQNVDSNSPIFNLLDMKNLSKLAGSAKKKGKLTYKVDTSGLANVKALAAQQKRNSSNSGTYTVEKTDQSKCPRQKSDDDHLQTYVKLQHTVCSTLFDSMVDLTKSRSVAIETLRRQLEVEWGRDRLQEMHALLTAARDNGLVCSDIIGQLTVRETLSFPLLQQVVVLEGLCDL